jgi:hypothetical protein
MFDSKVAIAVRNDLKTWQKLNVTAFLATGVAGADPGKLGEPYLDALGRPHAPMLRQPILVFAGARPELQAAHRRAIERGLGRAAYVAAMFATGHDAANRLAFSEEDPEAMDLVGLALWGPGKDVDKALKGLRLHGD